MAPSPTKTRGWTLGHAWGARVVLQPSTVLMIVVLAFLWGSSADGSVTGDGLARGGALALLLFLSVFIHELGHALAARAFRRKVNEIVITLWGGHTDFDTKDLTPKVAGVTAACGPLANIVVAAVAAMALTFPLPVGAEEAARWLAVVNGVLAAFNLLPGIPMDGGRVLEAIVWRASGKRTRGIIVAAWAGRAVALGYVAWVAYSNFGPGKTPDAFDLVWAFLIVSILWPAAGAALRAARILDRIDVGSVARLMRGAVPVHYEATVADAIAMAEGAEAEEVVVVAVDGKPAGHFAVAAAHEVPTARRAETPLSAVTVPLPRGAEVATELTGHELLEAIREWWGKTDVLAVLDEGEVVGVVRMDDVTGHLKGDPRRP